MKKNPPLLAGYQLPTQPHASSGRQAEGFVTPTQDLMPQVISIPPKRATHHFFAGNNGFQLAHECGQAGTNEKEK